MRKREGNTKRRAALTVRDKGWHVVSAGFTKDCYEAAGCTIITFWVVTDYMQDVLLSP